MFFLLTTVEAHFFYHTKPGPKILDVYLKGPKPIRPSDLRRQESKKEWL